MEREIHLALAPILWRDRPIPTQSLNALSGDQSAD